MDEAAGFSDLTRRRSFQLRGASWALVGKIGLGEGLWA